ncbi:restriction endonuclease subunit S [Desulfotignum phosphitoxidans]|jgi:type I restriction enzyme S subunit|uniref:Restriction endonuclease, type I, S subunit, EcoBI n=1 Tax=Desulfotignum phosphitoxidans DSM 13687 TaxID=1286635 RepID=S0FWR1_9BACT|nr:restriction endonuclease subunit S [Desulfotignum phosphitoxidans]EMS77579.1 restriction endonuclease, type I, S subunit, EcoBI [Desulfotignum phosphitoxidans DSM 13687]
MTKLKPGWKMVKFGDVVRQCKESVDRDNNPFERYVEGGHMDSEDIHINRWGEFGIDYVGPAFHRIFRKGQVLYGSRRTYLKKVAIADFDGITANTTFVCETKNPNVLMQELLPFLMLTDSFTEHSIRESKGSTNPYINWPDIAKYEFPLPPLDEQKRIAEILWAADEAVGKNIVSRQKATQLLDSMRINEVCSEKYHWQKFGTILKSIVAGKSVVGVNTPAEKHEFGVLKVSAVGPNGFEPEENKRLINSTDFLPQYSVNQGALLITRCNTNDLVGRVCLTPADYPNLMLCDKTLQLILDESKANRRFMFEALRARPLRNQIMGCATGTGGAMKNISQQDIRSLSVPLPPRDLQETIALRVANVYQRIDELTSQINMLRVLTKQLSNELIHGGAAHV